MKTIKITGFISMLVVSTLVLTGCLSSGNNSDNNAKQSTIVILKFKAQPDKGVNAVSELTNLIEKVKLEPDFIEIRLHVDSEDNTNILLYEEWGNGEYYKTAHMETDHMKEFMANSIDFLTGPPEISFWKIENVFK